MSRDYEPSTLEKARRGDLDDIDWIVDCFGTDPTILQAALLNVICKLKYMQTLVVRLEAERREAQNI